MDNIYNVRSIAARLKVSPATVYMWLEKGHDPDWNHDPTPEPTVRYFNSYNQEEYRLGWHESKLPLWDEWYMKYTSDKYNRRDSSEA